jgi:hypothetical protein
MFLFCHTTLKSKLRPGLIFFAIAIVPTALTLATGVGNRFFGLLDFVWGNPTAGASG